ncbi:MAG: Ig-like domain-containing protein [Gammaproteobacteria bacterium]|nr:Ig-like domain-containing protein [Gammaproteobacteria bacterium]
MKLSRIFTLLIVFLSLTLAGCGVKITNKTPDPLTRSANNRYTISALIERDSGAVYSDTIDAKVTINGTQYPMSGSGEGLWTYQHTAPGATAFEIHYNVDYRYNYALFTVHDGHDRAPETGSYHIDIIEPVASVSVAPASANIAVDITKQFTATLRDANGNTLTGRDINWSSSSNTIASINNSGLATAKREGNVTITATSEGQSDTAALSVFESETKRQLFLFLEAQANFGTANANQSSPKGNYQF